jgi:uroporphyrin-3 C-methyltransferase
MTHQDDDKPVQDASPDAIAGDDTEIEEYSAGSEAARDAESHPGPADSRPTQSGRLLVWTSLVGLLVALLAAAGTGYLWLEQSRQTENSQRLTARQLDLDMRTRELADLGSTVESLVAVDEQLAQQLSALTTRVDRQLEDIPMRLARIERTLDDIPGVDNQAQSAWLLAEAEYFLRIANAQLTLAGNVEVALRALALADQKLRDLADPGLTRVRSLLSDEQTALRAVPRPDSEGIVLALGSLARTLDTLPLDQNAPGRFGKASDERGTETGLQRAWRKIIEAFLNIISVKRADNAVTPLMSAAEESMLIRSLDIELQISRLALIRNEKDLYLRSLEAVAERLNRYFDGDAPEVIAALATVEKAAAAQLPDELPNISGSLGLLLQLRTEAASP